MSESRIELRPGYSISRIIKGGWQLAGGHGSFDRSQAIEDMVTFVDHGINTFDCADIYTGVEEMLGEAIGRLRQRSGFDADNDIQVHTKLVPDLDSLDTITHAELESIIDRSLDRLNLERLHMVQFYWWDLSKGDALASLHVLKEMQKKGKIRYLGCTNWDQFTMQQFTDSHFDMVSCQVQYSLLDQRPEGLFSQWCNAHQMKIFCYGVLAGGFITPYWLGKVDPGFDFDNRSLIKYRLIIEEFGSWSLFQELLQALSDIGLEHGVSLSSVATRYMLDQKEVAAVIIGAKTAAHLSETLSAIELVLTDENYRRLESILQRRQGPVGSVYALEKDRNGPHGRIMKYNLNG